MATENYYTITLESGKMLIGYTYINDSGQIFNCVSSSIEDCRRKRNIWIVDELLVRYFQDLFLVNINPAIWIRSEDVDEEIEWLFIETVKNLKK